ncbi:tetratricopeptide repeat protein [Paraburkholderia flava]|uniref:tetratricopeptide repeat protein n=1 Tax=Paraburkholderia flava TaxID=2547393 RepID=UPI001060982F|nr:tetratricopeptide repeat protein [Paraburkholderia flava]
MLFGRIAGLLEQGDLLGAARDIAQWRDAQPDDVGALTLAARLLRLRGRYAQAVATLEPALAVVGGFAPALVEIARSTRALGQHAVALQWFERAWAARSGSDADDTTDAWRGWPSEWVELLVQQERHQDAIAIAQAWCAADSERAQPWFVLGLSQQRIGELNAAFDAYSRAMQIDPDLPMLRNNLGALHNQLNDHATGRRLVLDVLNRDPENALAWVNLSSACLSLREPDNALLAAERACVLAPSYAEAHGARVSALKELQCWDDALAAAIRCVELTPHSPRVQWSVAMLQLVRGDYVNGLVNHEARWQGSIELGRTPTFYPERRWRGEDLVGKRLFVWGEQGLGDALQFVRFVPLIAERVKSAGGTLVYHTFDGLQSLFRHSLAHIGVQPIVGLNVDPASFDFHIPVGSLPLMFGTTPDTLPAAGGYLQADPARVERWRVKLGASRALRVGLVWSGSVGHQRNPLRSVEPEQYAQAFGGIEGVEFYSLQVGHGGDVMRMREQGLTVADPTPDLVSFDETAALMRNLDLVITVCTSVAHLGGALGVPTWLLLDVNPHWVWMLERRDSPWYSSLKLFRQRDYRDWSPVMGELRGEVRRLAFERTGV